MDREKNALLTLGTSDFQRVVLQSPQPALVDFTASWCGPCKALAPVIEGLASDYGDRVTVATVDVDDNPELAARYSVRSVPTVMLFADGGVKRVYVGARGPSEYRLGIDELLH